MSIEVRPIATLEDVLAYELQQRVKNTLDFDPSMSFNTFWTACVESGLALPAWHRSVLARNIIEAVEALESRGHANVQRHGRTRILAIRPTENFRLWQQGVIFTKAHQ